MSVADLQLAGCVTVFLLSFVLVTLAFARIARARAEAADGIGAEKVAAIEREFEIFAGIFAGLIIHYGVANSVNAISSHL